MKMKPHDVWALLKDSATKFIDDKAMRLSAALAYYTTLSLSPLLLAVVAIAGLAYGPEAARGEIVAQFRDTIGVEAASFVEQLIVKSSSKSDGIVAAIVAGGVLLFGASGVFSDMQSALNTIWKVPGHEVEGGILSIVKDRLLSFSLVCGAAFLLLTSLVVTAILAGINSRVSGWLPGMDALAQIVNFVFNFVLTAALFAMIFKWLPETTLSWHDVGIGAAVTALLFSVGRYLIGLYLGQAAVGSTYGAAGAFVVLLVWVYYSTMILLFGAELTFVYAQRFGSGVRTPDGALVEPRAASAPGLPSLASQ
ncbi:YihY/virulence factor BrkB family protein [Gemmata sp. JC717]|uniref:YihY/virulence factor BrkB family protein n=1 Tax=Gemmata algarum TaxID=2975278 RepID=UPI0021BABF47|nr:YihY/virulence factor BrkB family protein [Gemmata algarum]MDY3553103.1 YihY/virulence factor BrkB family protein [Gemmata algarum]